MINDCGLCSLARQITEGQDPKVVVALAITLGLRDSSIVVCGGCKMLLDIAATKTDEAVQSSEH